MHAERVRRNGAPGDARSRVGRPVIERLLAKVVIDDTGCWTFAGARNADGYGILQVAGRARNAFRVAYELLVGPVPDGLVLDHLCRNRACVNPDHLEPVTTRENLLRGDTFVARNAAKTHCSHGHPFDEVNTSRDQRGNRECRTCRLQTWAAYRARKRAAA
jgi:hypothetical protein